MEPITHPDPEMPERFQACMNSITERNEGLNVFALTRPLDKGAAAHLSKGASARGEGVPGKAMKGTGPEKFDGLIPIDQRFNAQGDPGVKPGTGEQCENYLAIQNAIKAKVKNAGARIRSGVIENYFVVDNLMGKFGFLYEKAQVLSRMDDWGQIRFIGCQEFEFGEDIKLKKPSNPVKELYDLFIKNPGFDQTVVAPFCVLEGRDLIVSGVELLALIYEIPKGKNSGIMKILKKAGWMEKPGFVKRMDRVAVDIINKCMGREKDPILHHGPESPPPLGRMDDRENFPARVYSPYDIEGKGRDFILESKEDMQGFISKYIDPAKYFISAMGAKPGGDSQSWHDWFSGTVPVVGGASAVNSRQRSMIHALTGRRGSTDDKLPGIWKKGG